MKEINEFFVNKILINLEKEKEKRLIEIKSIEEEKNSFDNMSYREKIEYKRKRNHVNIFNYTLILEASILLFLPFFFIGGLISSFFVNGFITIFSNAIGIGLSPFVLLFSLYFITFVFNNYLFLRPSFEKKLYNKMKNIYNINEQVSGEQKNEAIEEIRNIEFSEKEILSWETRSVLRKIKLNEKDIEKIKGIGFQYDLTLGKDLLDLYFLIRKN